MKFNVDEVFEIALQIERNGQKFYRRAAEFAPASTARFFEGLAAMEDDHEQTFSEMRQKLTGREGSLAGDPQGWGATYLRALAEGRIFDYQSDPSASLSGAEDVEEVLRQAIELEKDSIFFYLGLKQLVPDEPGKARVDEIIEPEMSHIATLHERLTGEGA